MGGAAWLLSNMKIQGKTKKNEEKQEKPTKNNPGPIVGGADRLVRISVSKYSETTSKVKARFQNHIQFSEFYF